MARYLVIGAIIGFALAFMFFKPETIQKVEVIETVRTDTVYQTVSDTIELTRERIKHVYLRDTIIKEQVYNLSRFNGLEPTLFGDISYNGLVAGELLKLNISTDFNIPQIENTITRTETKTIIQKPKGLYGTGGVNSRFEYSVGAIYLNDRSLFGYEYNIPTGSHSLKVGFRVF
jgi:hypothetical protein